MLKTYKNRILSPLQEMMIKEYEKKKEADKRLKERMIPLQKARKGLKSVPK